MMAHVEITHPAKHDLADILSYIAADNPTAAWRMLDRFTEIFNRLAQMPRLGEPYPHRNNALRQFSVGKYLVAYREIENGIAVLRVIHASRDWQTMLDAIDDLEW